MADGVATLVDAAMVLRRAGAFTGKLGEDPLRVLVAQLQAERAHQR